VPNILTLIRLILIPCFVLFFYLPFDLAHIVAAMIFLIAAFTDFLDGFLARKLNMETRLGQFLDPVVDKLMIATALVLLVNIYHHIDVVLCSIVMISREILISALREWMSEIGKRGIVAVSWIGKFKTFTQMVAITGLILFQSHVDSTLYYIALYALYIATLLTIISMLNYLYVAKNELR